MFNRKLMLDLITPLLKGRYGTFGDVSRQISSYLVNFGGVQRVTDDMKLFAVDFHGKLED